jgi:glyoxylase-like metal-dependent hydrolase (beta-lactamase superfamily II)
MIFVRDHQRWSTPGAFDGSRRCRPWVSVVGSTGLLREWKMNLVNVGYKSVNCYALEIREGYLLIDVGMPATFGKLVSVLKRKSVPLEKIRFLVVTHFHPDHCGVAQELKNAGVILLLGDVQERHLAEANRVLAKFPGYLPISDIGNAVVATDNRAAWKAATGLDGVLLYTPGHSDDSVTVVIDGVGAFVGDLRPPEVYIGSAAALAAESWQRIWAAGVRRAFPAHGPAFDLQARP